MRGKVVAVLGAVLILCTAAFAEPTPQQITTESWLGLSGLYVMPTARTIGQGRLGVNYNESKHVENFSNYRFMDRQIRAPFTYGLTENSEISVVYVSNQYDVSLSPVLENDSAVTFGAKIQICDETKSRPAVAFAVRDLTDSDTDADPLKNVHPGRKFFLLASKRLVDNKETGKFFDAHLGLANSSQQSVSGMFGMEVAMSSNMSFIAEGIWDSPYTNFRDTYVNGTRTGTSDHPGRFVFDIGLRMYPDVVPGMVIDTGFVGDGSFEFSFGMGYVFGL